MEQIECSETSAYINQTPGNHPKENKQSLFLAKTNTPSEDMFQLESRVEVSMNINSETKEKN